MAKKKKNPLLAASTMLPLAIAAASGSLPSLFPGPEAVSAKVFKVSCTLPFESIAQRHPIDSSCGPTGNVKLPDPRALQNRAKNNFCAKGIPVNIDFEVLHQLQQDAEDRGISFGNDSQIPDDRSELRHLPTKAGSIGEGTVARIAAFVIKARPSNVGKGKGESVNCKLTDKESNDIHIVLGEESNHDDECSSVTAEISPHFRPDIWDAGVLMNNNEHVYRFTGQLFFDASHRPCSGGKGSPKRSSIWEIHPVYAVDVCTDPNNNCRVDSEQGWVPLSGPVAEEETNETRLWLPDEISSRFASGRVPRQSTRYWTSDPVRPRPAL